MVVAGAAVENVFPGAAGQGIVPLIAGDCVAGAATDRVLDDHAKGNGKIVLGAERRKGPVIEVDGQGGGAAGAADRVVAAGIPDRLHLAVRSGIGVVAGAVVEVRPEARL